MQQDNNYTTGNISTSIIDPKNDALFKLIFGRECNKDLLISLINASLYGKINPVTDVEYIQSEKEIGLITPGTSRVDVSCTTTNNDNFIVEMQKSRRDFFIERCMVYNCSMYAGQKDRKYISMHDIEDRLVDDNSTSGYVNIYPVRLIGILNYIQFPNRPNQHLSHYRLIEDNSLDRDIDPLSLTFIELKKIKYTSPQDIKTDLDRWMLFFQHANHMTIDNFLSYVGQNNKQFEKAYQLLEYNSYTQEQRKVIDEAEEGISIKIGEINAAREDGRMEGREEGLKEVKKKNAIETARRMLADGMSVDMVMKYSCLSEDEVEKIKSNHEID